MKRFPILFLFLFVCLSAFGQITGGPPRTGTASEASVAVSAGTNMVAATNSTLVTLSLSDPLTMTTVNATTLNATNMNGNGSGLTNIPIAGITAPGTIHTNGMSVAATFSNTVTVVGATLTAPQIDYNTNTAAVTVDFQYGYNHFITNAAFTLLGPLNVDSTKTKVQTTVLMVTNSTAAAVAITSPAGTRSQGTQYVTNVTSITAVCYPWVVTNLIYLPLW